MARLPTPGSDDGTWGDILNDFLSQEHNPDGTQKTLPVVKGGTGATDAAGAKSNLGLGNVDNTSDANKPVSTATQTALNAKSTDASVVHNTGTETIAGVKTFSSAPVVPTPINTTDAANKSYVDTAAASGTPDATATVKGKVQLAGDLAGTAALPTVPALANKLDSATASTTYRSIAATLPNAVQDYGADPTGATDSTTALQNWINAFTAANKPGFIPPGIYKVSSTLTIANKFGTGIVGSPGLPRGIAAGSTAANNGVRLQWTGSSGGTVLSLAGIQQSYFSDFTIDGNGLAAIGIDYGATGTIVTDRNFFERIAVYSCTDKGVRVGSGHQQADLTDWYSCAFVSNTNYGVSIEWSQSVFHRFYSCTFSNQGTGIAETQGSANGHFDAFGCSFGVHSVVDISLSNTRAHTLTGCHSEGSAMFLQGPNGSATASPVNLIGCSVNTISSVNGIGIVWPSGGPLNIIGGFYKSGQTIPFKITSGTSGNGTQSTITTIGVSFCDTVGAPWTGQSAGTFITNIGTSYQNAGVTNLISGTGEVPIGSPASPLGAVNAVAASAPNANYAGVAWVRLPSGTALVTGANTFYLKSRHCNGFGAVEITRIASMGGADSVLLGISGSDDNATNALTAKLNIRVSSNVTLSSDLVFAVRFVREPVTF